jgi:N-hydroxyarylamine O-acetyltransferase
MTNALDVFACLRRIGHNGPRAPTFATLRTVHARHPAAIPFKNLDPLLGRPVLLDLPSLQAKLVQQRRGGYCFEQNTLFAAALETLGFQITTLAARVVWRSEDSPRTHMLISVNLNDGPYIVDVGFGGYLFAAPLKIEPGLEQKTHCGVFRILRTRDEFTVQTALDRVAGRISLYPRAAYSSGLRSREVDHGHASEVPFHEQLIGRAGYSREPLQHLQYASNREAREQARC